MNNGEEVNGIRQNMSEPVLGAIMLQDLNEETKASRKESVRPLQGNYCSNSSFGTLLNPVGLFNRQRTCQHGLSMSQQPSLSLDLARLRRVQPCPLWRVFDATLSHPLAPARPGLSNCLWTIRTSNEPCLRLGPCSVE